MPRLSSQFSSIPWCPLVTCASRQMVRRSLVTLLSSTVTPLLHVGYFVFAAFASAFMLKVSDAFHRATKLGGLSGLPRCSFCAKNARNSSPPDSRQRSIKSSSALSTRLGHHKLQSMNVIRQSYTPAFWRACYRNISVTVQ